MLYMLVAGVVLLTAADHWTTYLCLRAPVPGWQVAEANPLASWLFSSVGLVPGLVLDTAATLGAIAFLLTTDLFPRIATTGFFGFVVLGTAYAVVNNLGALQVLDRFPLGLP